MNIIIKFFHQLFSPHCPHCKLDDEDDKICNNCEYLRMMIAQLQKKNERLLNNILNDTPKVNTNVDEPIPLPVNLGGHIPWRVKRQQIEADDRARASKLRENLIHQYDEKIESLENEILNVNTSDIKIEYEMKNGTKLPEEDGVKIG